MGERPIVVHADRKLTQLSTQLFVDGMLEYPYSCSSISLIIAPTYSRLELGVLRDNSLSANLVLLFNVHHFSRFALGLITMRVWSIYGRQKNVFNFLSITFVICQLGTLVITIKASLLMVRKYQFLPTRFQNAMTHLIPLQRTEDRFRLPIYVMAKSRRFSGLSGSPI
jgi:hypothetical protein